MVDLVRIGALASARDGRIELLGYGTHQGSHEVSEDAVGYKAQAMRRRGLPNSKLVLDDGQVVFGCECWWGLEADVRADVEKRQANGDELVTITVEQMRHNTGAELAKKAESDEPKS